jgi:hypothetical protein
MSKKLWVAYEALARRFGPTRVSIDGCSDVAHFKGSIRNFSLSKLPFETDLYLTSLKILPSLFTNLMELLKLKLEPLLLIIWKEILLEIH